jgi:lysine-N-methylase
VSVNCRLRQCLALAQLCRQAQYEKVRGDRLKEFLHVVSAGVSDDVPREAGLLPPPSPLGRLLFRQILAVYTRRDQGSQRGPAARGRLALLQAALQFARGQGNVPRLHALIPPVTFEEIEQRTGRATEGAEAILERYYQMKLGSLQFCGPSNFRLALWDGLESLLVTYPVIRWLSRAFADLSPEAATERALTIVDYHFGYNPLLGARRQRLSLRILVGRGDLDKLIAWYSR